jgi:hypothetical protein
LLRWHRHPCCAGIVTLVMLASLACLCCRCNGILFCPRCTGIAAVAALALLPLSCWHCCRSCAGVVALIALASSQLASLPSLRRCCCHLQWRRQRRCTGVFAVGLWMHSQTPVARGGGRCCRACRGVDCKCPHLLVTWGGGGGGPNNGEFSIAIALLACLFLLTLVDGCYCGCRPSLTPPLCLHTSPSHHLTLLSCAASRVHPSPPTLFAPAGCCIASCCLLSPPPLPPPLHLFASGCAGDSTVVRSPDNDSK